MWIYSLTEQHGEAILDVPLCISHFLPHSHHKLLYLRMNFCGDAPYSVTKLLDIQSGPLIF